MAAVPQMGASALDAAAEPYLAAPHALAPDKVRIMDKMPGNHMPPGLPGLLFPKAKIIHRVRGPRDIGLPVSTFWFHGHHGHAHGLGDPGWTIVQWQRLVAPWREALSNPILTVKLSVWIEDFDAPLDRVLTHLDLPHDPNCARFHEAKSPVRTVSRARACQPVNARGLRRWRRHERERHPLIAEPRRGHAPEACRSAPISTSPATFERQSSS